MNGTRKVFILLLAVCLLTACIQPSLADDYEPQAEEVLTYFRFFMEDLGCPYYEESESWGGTVVYTLRDRPFNSATDWTTGWNYDYQFRLTAGGLSSPVTSIEFEMPVIRTLKPGKYTARLRDALEAMLAAVEVMFYDGDLISRFQQYYNQSNLWNVLRHAVEDGDFNEDALSVRIGKRNFSVGVAYGENEMHFYFMME